MKTNSLAFQYLLHKIIPSRVSPPKPSCFIGCSLIQYIVIKRMLEDRNVLKLRQLQKYFVPAGIDAKLILQAFKIQQNKRMLASCRSKQFGIEHKIEEQVSKLDFLQVTGRQSVIPESLRRASHKKGIKDIRLVLDNPISRIVDVIAQDPDSRLYQRQLSELQRLSSSSSPKEVASPDKDISLNKGAFSQKDLETPLFRRMPKHQSIETPKQDMEYYQQMILNNPVLYRKVMMAYNASKRQLERQQLQEHRKVSQRRETIYETKFNFKQNVTDGHKSGTTKSPPGLFQAREFQLAVTLTNKLLVYPQQDLQYRAFVCKGNNGLLVKSILKTRPWWSLRSYSEMDSCNLVWTQWKKTKVVNRLNNTAIKVGQPNAKNVDLNSHSKKRELVLLAQKKMNAFRKIAMKQDELWLKYQKIPQFQNYLKFTSKINQPKFDDITKLVFRQDYTHLEVQKDHRAHNHVPGCLQLHSKKLLFLNLKKYYEKQQKDIFSVIPLTFHISKGSDDPEFSRFAEYFEKQASQIKSKAKSSHNIWICKPGENSNRGNGISVLNNLNQIKNLANQKCIGNRTLIIQRYFQNPFLYNKRKFDIRCYILITTVNGIVKGYWYEQGYIRTASKQFSLKNLENKFIHLTNDAIQKKGEEYGKFQNYNKVSYVDFEKYLDQTAQEGQRFNFGDTVQRMKQIATDLIFATARKLNPKRKEYCFQIFGLDFMLDDHLAPFLIEANSNPCIEVDGSVLGKVIPTMLQNVIRVAIDPIFPPPYSESIKNRYTASNMFQSNKMVLVYDSYLHNETKPEIDEKQQKSVNQEEMEEHQLEIQ